MSVELHSTSLRPPLKWAGGKRWQLPHIQPIWNTHRNRRFIEPFCGGLAISLGLAPDRALLGDANRHLINFYDWLKKGLTINIPMANDRALYYEYRERFNALITLGECESREAASLFYYLNRTGFNGLCRFNQRGVYNVPFGRYERINYVRDFTAYRDTFSRWDLTSGDFERMDIGSGDFVYADPPYDVEFTNYSQGGFSWEDQKRVAEFLAKHRGPVILVNQATRRIKRLYQDLGYKTIIIDAPRRISCTGDRTPASEVIATRHL